MTSQARLDILQTPDIYIDMRSTAREVQAWLKAKQFSNRLDNEILLMTFIYEKH